MRARNGDSASAENDPARRLGDTLRRSVPDEPFYWYVIEYHLPLSGTDTTGSSPRWRRSWPSQSRGPWNIGVTGGGGTNAHRGRVQRLIVDAVLDFQ